MLVGMYVILLPARLWLCRAGHARGRYVPRSWSWVVATKRTLSISTLVPNFGEAALHVQPMRVPAQPSSALCVALGVMLAVERHRTSRGADFPSVDWQTTGVARPSLPQGSLRMQQRTASDSGTSAVAEMVGGGGGCWTVRTGVSVGGD